MNDFIEKNDKVDVSTNTEKKIFINVMKNYILNNEKNTDNEIKYENNLNDLKIKSIFHKNKNINTNHNENNKNNNDLSNNLLIKNINNIFVNTIKKLDKKENFSSSINNYSFYPIINNKNETYNKQKFIKNIFKKKINDIKIKNDNYKQIKYNFDNNNITKFNADINFYKDNINNYNNNFEFKKIIKLKKNNSVKINNINKFKENFSFNKLYKNNSYISINNNNNKRQLLNQIKNIKKIKLFENEKIIESFLYKNKIKNNKKVIKNNFSDSNIIHEISLNNENNKEIFNKTNKSFNIKKNYLKFIKFKYDELRDNYILNNINSKRKIKQNLRNNYNPIKNL